MKIAQTLPATRIAGGTLSLLMAFTLAWIVPTAAEAGELALGFDLGYTDFDSKVSADSDYRGDFRVSYFFNDHFELEGQFVHCRAILSTTLEVYFINGVFNFDTDKPFVPYVLVGVGSASLRASRLFSVSEDENSIAYQVAFGGRRYFGSAQRFGLRIEVSALSEDTFDESKLHTSLVAGLTWRFGG